jgi:F-type H+-transporting ATPase subunit a
MLRAAVAALVLLGLGVSPAAAEVPQEAPKKSEEKPPSSAGHGGEKKSNTPPAMEHVLDADHFHLFDSIESLRDIHLPRIFGLQITKFMVLELIAAGIIIAIYVPMCRRLHDGRPPKGAWDNTFEGVLTFVRDNIARPALGEGTADRYLPFLWTLFLFILINNLMGMVPFMASPTASIYVTGALALVVFFVLHGSAAVEMGQAGAGHHDGHGDGAASHAHEHHEHTHGEAAAAAGGVLALAARGFVSYVNSMWPQMDVPFVMGLFIKPLVFVIEVIGVLVRNAVLAVRLFANMFAGHMVLATILFFIQAAATTYWALWGTVTVSSVVGILLLSLLELFVACLQAYVFTFLTALFMGMGMHPEH